MTRKWTSVADAIQRRDLPEAEKIIRHALLQTNGDISRAAWSLFVTRKQLHAWIRWLDLFPLVDRIRRRAEVPLWLAKTAAALKGRPMSAWEKVMAGIQGMTVEDVDAMLQASPHAARISDTKAFAEALVAAAAEQ